jgi:hypothetical protein
MPSLSPLEIYVSETPVISKWIFKLYEISLEFFKEIKNHLSELRSLYSISSNKNINTLKITCSYFDEEEHEINNLI